VVDIIRRAYSQEYRIPCTNGVASAAAAQAAARVKPEMAPSLHSLLETSGKG